MKFFVALLFSISLVTSQAQEIEEPVLCEDIFIFGGVVVKQTHIDGLGGTLVGGRGGSMQRDRYSFGFGGYTLLTNREHSDLMDGKSLSVRMGYLGGVFEYFLKPVRTEKWSLSFPVLIGFGNMAYFENLDEIQREKFFVAEPEIMFNWRLSPKTALGAGINYRITTQTLADLNHAGVSLMFRFGCF